MMRILLAAAALAAGPASAPATAQQGASSTAFLAPGETLLEIEAEGRSRVPAGHARLLVSIAGRGATAAAARRKAEEDVGRMRQAALAAGVAAVDINPVRGMSPIGFVGNAAEGEYELPAAIVPEAGAMQRHSTRTLELLVRDPAAAERIRQAVEESGAGSSSPPIYEAADEDAARRAARADAFVRARADAEALAARAGMRVVRVIRIGERRGSEALSTALMRAYAGMTGPTARGTEVETIVQLSVDFALAPR